MWFVVHLQRVWAVVLMGPFLLSIVWNLSGFVNSAADRRHLSAPSSLGTNHQSLSQHPRMDRLRSYMFITMGMVELGHEGMPSLNYMLSGN